MTTNFEKMVAGEDYWINDPDLADIRFKTRDLVDDFNETKSRETDKKTKILKQIFGDIGEGLHIEKPLRVDYGINTKIGNNVFINFNFVILDCAPVTIGNNVFIAPNVQIYTAAHPVELAQRKAHVGFAAPITIGNDVWIGGGVIILPGVTIGNGTTIAAGSVVTKDIPDNCLAKGSPCKVHKQL